MQSEIDCPWCGTPIETIPAVEPILCPYCDRFFDLEDLGKTREVIREPLTALRKIFALTSDYLAHDFPTSIEEMTVEFTEIIEEIDAVARVFVEDD